MSRPAHRSQPTALMPTPRKKKPTPNKPRQSGGGSTNARGPKRAPAGKPRPARRPNNPAPAQPASSLPGERLQKVLAAAGIASRRECEILITEGRVEVDGQIVSELGVRVEPAKQDIRVDGEPLRKSRKLYFAVNKPRGVVSTLRDPAGRPRVIDLIPPDAGRVFNVGRLDMESEGLILATNDGELANKLTHPRHGVEKIYQVQVAGFVEPDVLQQLRRGTHLADGFVRPVDVRIKSHVKKSTVLEMTLDEGRNREIRRLLARVGHKVQKLVRIAVGPVRLGELPLGAVRPLTREEVGKLEQAVAGAVTTARPAPRPRTGAPKKRPSGSGKAAAAGPTRAVIGGNAAEADDKPRGAKKAPGKPAAGTRPAKSAGKPAGPLGKKRPAKGAAKGPARDKSSQGAKKGPKRGKR